MDIMLIPDTGGPLKRYNLSFKGQLWVTSDWHLGHKNIIRFCNRPFGSVEEMDQAIIDRCNSCVGPDDFLLNLGDFAWLKYADDIDGLVDSYCKRLRCKNLALIWGNHDKKLRDSNKLHKWFQHCAPRIEVRVGDKVYLCDHYPLDSWDRSFHGSRLLYGHCHGTKEDPALPTYDPALLRMDMGVDLHNFYPLNVDQIEGILAPKAAERERRYPTKERTGEQW